MIPLFICGALARGRQRYSLVLQIDSATKFLIPSETNPRDRDVNECTGENNRLAVGDFGHKRQVPPTAIIFASSEKSVGHRYAPMAAGSSARATLSRLCYLGRVLVRVSRDSQAKPPDPQRKPVCNCGTDGFVCRLRSKAFLRISNHAASAIPPGTRIRAATVSGFRD